MTPRVFRLRLDGEVGGKGRPRARVIFTGGKPLATMYPDPDSAKTEKLIKGLAYVAMRGQPQFDVPVECLIQIWLPHPQSWTRKKREAAAGYYVGVKPDCDNIAKLVCDAMNEVVWRDDCLVADLVVRRRYHLTPAAPVCLITVTELLRPADDGVLTV